MEKDLFNNFWDHEKKTSANEVQLIIFNKSVEVIETEMTKTKASEIINMLRGNVKTPLVRSEKHMDGLIELPDSTRIAAVKVGCSPENKNLLLDRFVKEKDIFASSLTKECCLSMHTDDYLLVGIDFLNVVKLGN